MVYAQIQIFLPFIESKAIEGERKLTYWCMPAVLNSQFFLSLVTPYFSFLFFYFLSFSMLTSGLWFFLEIHITMIFRIPPSNAQQGVLYIEPAVTGIYYFSP